MTCLSLLFDNLIMDRNKSNAPHAIPPFLIGVYVLISFIFHNRISFQCTDIDDCLPDPCENNGTCTDLINDYHCDCVAGYNGTICENSKHHCFQKCRNHFVSRNVSVLFFVKLIQCIYM